MPHLTGPTIKPLTGTAPKKLVILLHGWGADGANLIDLGQAMRESLPHAQFTAPNAPDVCEANPYGYQWFSLNDRRPESLLSGIRRAETVLNTFIDEQLAALSLTDADLALIGFSQGTMLALHTALRRANPCAAIVGFSGALIASETLNGEIRARPPVCLIHGELDDIVPFAAMPSAEKFLRAADVRIETHARPMLTHSIDMEGLATAERFLRENLA